MLRLFDLLASTSKLAPEIRDGVRAHPYRSHIVVYREAADELQILHIRHKRSNWRKHLWGLPFRLIAPILTLLPGACGTSYPRGLIDL